MATIGKIRTYLEKNFSPMAWNRIKIRLLPQFNERGIFLHTMNDEQELDKSLLQLINETLIKMYEKGLPFEQVKQ